MPPVGQIGVQKIRGQLKGWRDDAYGSYQRARDELQMLLLTDEQVYSAAYVLVGYEKWLKKRQGGALKPVARRKVIKQLLTTAGLKFKNPDIGTVVEQAAQIDAAPIRITATLSALYKKIKV
jgi:hypothetical protein